MKSFTPYIIISDDMQIIFLFCIKNNYDWTHQQETVFFFLKGKKCKNGLTTLWLMCVYVCIQKGENEL